MNCPDAVNVCEYLRNKEIQLLPNNTWLKSCINWYKSHVELSNIYGSLQEYVCIQWLLADLQDVQHRCLPTNYEDTNIELTGKYTVQINWMRDIGQSCYSQLQAVKNSNESKSNDYVTADEPIKQNWEPNPKRVLLMEVTDGLTTLKAMEYSPIGHITEPFIPGLKVVLTGPVECRKGIIFLKSNNISLLGGEVDHLYETNSKVNFLSRCLNIATDNETQDRGTGDVVTSNYTSQNSTLSNKVQLFDDIQTLRHSTPVVDRNNYADDRGRLMADEDDDFLCQLPDEVLEGTDNFEPEPNKVSPIFCERAFTNDLQMAFEKRPQIKKAVVKVESITKLKIRSGEWHCCVNALVENESMDVSFNNKVLEKLFGMSATEVEVWRSEMSTNLSLKKKVNDILKAGQTKLKMLNCEMTLDCSSNDCMPQIVTIHKI